MRTLPKMESNKNDKLRHRIHQWSAIKFVNMLKIQPIEVDEVSESYTSSTNPFDGEKLRKRKQVVEKVIRVFNPYLMTAHEGGWIKVFKVDAGYLESWQALLERDSIAPLNLARKVNGWVVAFSNKSFAQTSSIVLANIATWVLSTHVAIRGGLTYLGS